jgi:3-mercaptopyruvate sulfurtransferase SseA
MNQYILLAILLVAFALWTFKKNIAITGALQLRPLEAKNRLDAENGIILLDVRTKGEYRERHIPKSKLIPLDVLTKEASIKLPDKNAEIFAEAGAAVP